MSGSAAQAAWNALPKATQVRQATVAVLIAADTLAGQSVIDTPLQDFDESQLPAIAVMSKIRRDPISQAGTSQRFRVTMTLRVQVVVDSAAPSLVLQQLDQLEQQVLDALLQDPQWLGLVGPLGSIETSRDFPRPGETLRGLVMHDISVSWFEKYGSAAASALQPGGIPLGVPGATNPVAPPLTTVTITEQAPTTNSSGASVEETLVEQTISLPQS